jgi:hypothetical protein
MYATSFKFKKSHIKQTVESQSFSKGHTYIHLLHFKISLYIKSTVLKAGKQFLKTIALCVRLLYPQLIIFNFMFILVRLQLLQQLGVLCLRLVARIRVVCVQLFDCRFRMGGLVLRWFWTCRGRTLCMHVWMCVCMYVRMYVCTCVPWLI